MPDWLAHHDFAHNSLLAWLYVIGGAVLTALLVTTILNAITRHLEHAQSRNARPTRTAAICVLRATRR